MTQRIHKKKQNAVFLTMSRNEWLWMKRWLFTSLPNSIRVFIVQGKRVQWAFPTRLLLLGKTQKNSDRCTRDQDIGISCLNNSCLGREPRMRRR